MKIPTLLLLTFCFAISNLFSQDTIIGGVVSGTWTKAHSPYIITGAIMVANGTKLTIEPGVKIEFQGSFKFLNLGQITAIGNASDSIIFTAKNSVTGWRGIRLDHTDAANDSSRLVYCRFSYGNVKGLSSISSNDGSGGAIGIFGSSKVLISHCTLTHCSADDAGAIYCGSSGARIVNNLFSVNTAGSVGALELYSFNVTTIVSNNRFVNNTSTGTSFSYGGAIATWDGSEISHNTFIGNTSMAGDYSGGAIYCGSSGSPKIHNNIFINNCSPNGSGGAIYSYENSPDIYNNLIVNNSALAGGGIHCESVNGNLYNNTIANNSAVRGGAMDFTLSSTTIKNTVMWGNRASVGGNQVFLGDENSDPNFYYCNIEGGQTGIGIVSNAFYLGTYTNNIAADPDFVAPTANTGTSTSTTGQWFVKSGSPCIDAGDPSGSYSATDLNNWPRISNNRIDIGAYEFSIINGIKNNGAIFALTIFPNPSSGQLIVSTSDIKLTEVQVYDSKGIPVLSEKLLTQQDQVILNLNDQPDGFYFVKSTSDKGSQVNKIILQR